MGGSLPPSLVSKIIRPLHVSWAALPGTSPLLEGIHTFRKGLTQTRAPGWRDPARPKRDAIE